MKIAVVLLTLMFILAVIPETSAWRIRSAFNKAVKAAGRVARKAIEGAKHVLRKKYTLGKRSDLLNEEISDEDFLKAITDRDISDLVDDSQMTDAEIAELSAIQRDLRELTDELED